MSIYIIDIEQDIKKYLEKGIYKILDKSYSHDFDTYITNNFEWLPTRIDWEESKIEFKEFNIYSLSSDKIENILM